MVEKQKGIEQEFIELFVLELIKLSQPDWIPYKNTSVKVPQVNHEHLKKIVQEEGVQPLMPSLKPRPQPRVMPVAMPVKRQAKPRGIPAQSPLLDLPAMRKLKFILDDPAVISIECPGPDKPLIANKFGRTETTQVHLSKEEITEIMEEFSEQTRIPLVSGVFKAFSGNLLITAVISEFVGTRFLIRKRRFLRTPPRNLVVRSR